MRDCIKKLVFVKELLSNEKRWTKKSEARDDEGKVVSYHSSKAECWCLLGAIHKCCNSSYSRLSRDTAHALSDVLDQPIHRFNDADSTTYTDVLRVLDDTIERG